MSSVSPPKTKLAHVRPFRLVPLSPIAVGCHMRIELLTIVAALGVASSAVAQGTDKPVDGSAPGSVLLVLRERPPGKPALIVREPPNSNGNVRQRSII